MKALPIHVAATCLGIALSLSVAHGAEPVSVVAGIPPVVHLIERVGGPHVSVQVLSSGGSCVHQLALTPKQAVALGKARLFVTVGLPFETQLHEKLRTTQPKLKFVDIAAGITRRALDEAANQHEGHAHAAAEAHDHDHEADDPHVWLLPANVKVLAANIAAALAEVDPDHAADFRARHEQLGKEITATAERVDLALRPLRNQKVYVYHPSLGYLLDAYAVKQVAVESGGKAPSARALRDLIHRAKADEVKAIFVEQQADMRAAEAVAQAVGCTLVPFDPLAKDVLKNLESVAEKLEAGGRNRQDR